MHWKTGTSYGHRDAWAVGSGAQLHRRGLARQLRQPGRLRPRRRRCGRPDPLRPARGRWSRDAFRRPRARRRASSGSTSAPTPATSPAPPAQRASGCWPCAPRCRRAAARTTSRSTSTSRAAWRCSPPAAAATAGRRASFVTWPASLRRWLGERQRWLPEPPPLAPGCEAPPEPGRAAHPLAAAGQVLVLLPGVPAKRQEVPLQGEAGGGGAPLLVRRRRVPRQRAGRGAALVAAGRRPPPHHRRRRRRPHRRARAAGARGPRRLRRRTGRPFDDSDRDADARHHRRALRPGALRAAQPCFGCGPANAQGPAASAASRPRRRRGARLHVDAGAAPRGVPGRAQRRHRRHAARLPQQLDRGLAPDASRRPRQAAVHGDGGVPRPHAPPDADRRAASQLRARVVEASGDRGQGRGGARRRAAR